MPNLVEGEDYTIEDGLIVFTREYLLRRGYCCGSICQNCPYGEDIQRAAAGKRIGE